MKPLEGVKVLELSTMITASFAAMMLAEQGARVTKVEPLELGDPMRILGSQKGGLSALFANCNRGKRSVRLDVKKPEGRQIVEELACDADILLCNFRPGIMDKLGLGSEHLRRLNPRLIYGGVSGFGTAGPERDTPAYDTVIQAQSGFAAVQGEGRATGPEFVRNLTCDKVTAYTACQAVTAALYAREKNGQGQHIDLSMMDAGLYFIFPDGFMHHTLLDEDAEHLAPLSAFMYEMSITKDGAVSMSAGTQAQQVGLLKALDQSYLLADERFNGQEKLIANIAQLRDILRDVMLELTTEELLAKLKENDVPAARLMNYDEVLGLPQYAATQTIDTIDHPILGNMRRVKPPAQFGGERLEPASNSPAHGEHTLDVLRELGRSEADIAVMAQTGVIANETPG